jgi:sialate O-acetylesterase
MVHPIAPYALKGIVWYQGESNVDRAWQYRTTFPLLIKNWRTTWERDDLPFFFCQLPNYQPKQLQPGESSWAELREAQSLARKIPHTAEAVLIDLGESLVLHPSNKKDAADRLSRIALSQIYGKDIPHSGPVYQSFKIEDGKIRLSFTYTDGGLIASSLPATYDQDASAGETAPLIRNSPDSELEGFAICGKDRKWVWADSKIEGSSVVVWSDQVPAPVAVRYAWADNPTCNLSNGSGLPASPFRTDDFPATTLDAKY